MSTINEVKSDLRDFRKFLLRAFLIVFAVIYWLFTIPFALYFPWKMENLFPYRFRQLFFHRPYWLDVFEALARRNNDETPYWRWLFLIGLISPLSIPLVIIMYITAYNNLGLMYQQQKPRLSIKSRLVKAVMLFGAMIPLYVLIIYSIAQLTAVHTTSTKTMFGMYLTLRFQFAGLHFSDVWNATLQMILRMFHFVFGMLPVWIVGVTVLHRLIYALFEGWRRGVYEYLSQVGRHGTAEFASQEDLDKSSSQGPNARGLYIGDGRYYNKPGHILTGAGTRGGKGVNLVIPNLTRLGRFDGSFVIIDPKGENAAITARVQKEQLGRKVVVLNPWGLHTKESPHLKGMAYNPLDLLTDASDDNFVDDAQLIAEMIVPKSTKSEKEDFFEERARTIIAGYIMQIAVTETGERRTLTTLYEVLRQGEDEMAEYLGEMAKSDVFAIKAVANELKSLAGSEKTFSSVMASVHSATDFIKSPPLQRALTSSEFKMSELTDGKTALYIIIPADKLKTHYQWLRLVVTTALRGVVRNPNKDVCFLLDEFAALGYISEIDTALSTYAGYGVHIWAILQNLVQLKNMYHDNWESFVSACSVRHFFNVSEVFSLKYLSELFGKTTIPVYNGLGAITGGTERSLITPDELRRVSGEDMFAVIDSLPVARIKKHPYLTMEDLVEGIDYDPNPYHANKEKPEQNPEPNAPNPPSHENEI